MSRNIFDSFDAECGRLCEDIAKVVAEMNLAIDEHVSGNRIKDGERLLSDADDLLKQMNLEVRTGDPSSRVVRTEKVDFRRKQISSLRLEFSRLKEKSERSSLIGNQSAGDRQRYMDVDQKCVWKPNISLLAE